MQYNAILCDTADASSPRLVGRATITTGRKATPRQIADAAKVALGIRPSARCRVSDYGDSIEVRFPRNAALAAFIVPASSN